MGAGAGGRASSAPRRGVGARKITNDDPGGGGARVARRAGRRARFAGDARRGGYAR